MNKAKLKQGTLAWENAREKRIGSSEVFDIVRYYATNEELQNCGINAEDFKSEKPYTTAWALYHKILDTGFYAREELAPEFAQYGHAIEPYGLKLLQCNRKKKLKHGEVFMSDNLIASLDVSGTAEEIDTFHNFDYGKGKPKEGQKFVCEQKSMNPKTFKNGLPFKYIVQAQYQITAVNADFFILQLVVLDEDTPFERGRICQMGRIQKNTYLDTNATTYCLYFANNEPLAQLIKICLQRFFKAVEDKEEPTPYIANDTQRNIIESIRLNSVYSDKLTLKYNLQDYVIAKENEEKAKQERLDILQKIVEQAKDHNASKFNCTESKYTASFSKAGSFLLKEPKE